MIIEACVQSFSEAVTALINGADRIELCENLTVGGTTPSYGTIKMCCRELKIPVIVMIRPRAGDFCYSDLEFEIMQDDIRICKELGVQGVAFGILTEHKTIDVERTQKLVDLSKPMQTVFHRAFDEVEDPYEALDELMGLRITRVLTSGTKPTALEGQEIIRKLIKQSFNRISILVGGRVTADNLKEIQNLIPATEFHGRKIVGDL
jgi:copper homeostasis protein